MYTQGPRDERFTRGEGIPGIATTPAKMKSASNRTSVIPTQRSARACRQAATFTGGDQREPRYLMAETRVSPLEGVTRPRRAKAARGSRGARERRNPWVARPRPEPGGGGMGVW